MNLKDILIVSAIGTHYILAIGLCLSFAYRYYKY